MVSELAGKQAAGKNLSMLYLRSPELWDLDTWDIGCGCWCDLDLTFDLNVVTVSLKILSELYLRNCKVHEVDTW